MAISTQIKRSVNLLLNPIGLALDTTLADRTETARLRNLQSQGHWTRPHYDAGIPFDVSKYSQFLQDVCIPYKEEYVALPSLQENTQGGYFLDNPYFGAVDAEVYYSMIRRFQPNQVVEIGSGFSSRLARKAIDAGASKTKLTCIDPRPRTEISQYAHEHKQGLVQQVSSQFFCDALEENDILFIDSSHEIRTGGDVPYLFLEVLPRLKPGVIIHVHDIFLPFEYPESWVVKFRYPWPEQYLVHAFLLGNTDYDILWPSRFMWANQRSEVAKAIPSAVDASDGSINGRATPGSLWIRKIR